jgi:hypothetical protein
MVMQHPIPLNFKDCRLWKRETSAKATHLLFPAFNLGCDKRVVVRDRINPLQAPRLARHIHEIKYHGIPSGNHIVDNLLLQLVAAGPQL